MTSIEIKVIDAQQIDDDLLRHVGSQIRHHGHIVVLPTETVYGLGANALDVVAVKKIFQVKQRPADDPLICHVLNVEEACRLFELSSDEVQVVRALAEQFWPGPLSICAKASSLIPAEVTAHTGYVAVRCPAHKVAQDLIKAAGVPIAAPSANPFGRISPTSVSHVLKYFSQITMTDQHDLYIFDSGPCQIGIESSVCKIECTRNQASLLLLRRGQIDEHALLQCVQKKCPQLTSHIYTDIHSNQSPGMCLKHYAPVIDTYILQPDYSNLTSYVLAADQQLPIADCIVVDFLNEFPQIQPFCMKYFSVCKNNQLTILCHQLYACLHEAEEYAIIEQAHGILIIEMMDSKSLQNSKAVYDRVYRAASGRTAKFIPADQTEQSLEKKI